jgi:hydroxyacylglutathione hydrolase
MGAVGRTDLPDSNEADLNESIRRIMKLPADTRLFPGHGQSTTLAEELRSNAFVSQAVNARQ